MKVGDIAVAPVMSACVAPVIDAERRGAGHACQKIRCARAAVRKASLAVENFASLVARDSAHAEFAM